MGGEKLTILGGDGGVVLVCMMFLVGVRALVMRVLWCIQVAAGSS